MPSTRLNGVPALACALVLFTAACGENKPITGVVTCEPDGATPDGAAPDAYANPDIIAAADSVADLAAAQDLAGAADRPPSTDALAQYDGQLADGPLPPGITLGGYDIPHPTLSVSLSFGLLADLRASTGHALAAFVHISDVIHVALGYTGDIVYMKYGRLGPPAGTIVQPGVNYPFVATFGGPRVFEDDGSQNPEAAPAYVLFAAMTKVPETTDAYGRVRESPNGRIRCNLPRDYDAAYCVFTGVTSAGMTHPPRYARGADGGPSAD